MQYRVAVAYQNAAWEKGSEELTRLFSKVKQEECIRRMNLREFLVAFVQRQQRLFLALPAMQNSVLESLVGVEVSKEDMEKEIQSTIEERTAKYKKSARLSENDMQLESPLTSDLTSKAKVIERKGTGMGSIWTTSLAIMTADAYLHLFDLENIDLGTSAEDAFKAITPTVIVPNEDNLLMGKSNFSKGWSDPLTPTDSLILGNCKIQSKDATSFELTERVASTGAQRMLGKSATKKILFRTQSKSETEDWIAVLTA